MGDRRSVGGTRAPSEEATTCTPLDQTRLSHLSGRCAGESGPRTATSEAAVPRNLGQKSLRGLTILLFLFVCFMMRGECGISMNRGVGSADLLLLVLQALT